MIRLGRFHYPHPVLVLAPMAGISDLPFRRLCHQLGADFSIAEMIDARPDLMQSAKTARKILFDDNAHFPKIVQLVGGNARLLAQAAQEMQAKGVDAIDLNFGCPAKRVGQQNAGSALLKDMDQVEHIIHTVRQACDLPLTIKTRLGFDERTPTLKRMGEIADRYQIAALTIHGRTRADKFQNHARYDSIGELKATINTPIIVNGDIDSAQKAKELIDTYHFDGVMVGRATQGNPWLLYEIRRTLDPNFSAQSIDKEKDILNHIQELHQLYQDFGVLHARKHLHWYFAQKDNYPELRKKINHMKNPCEQLELTQQAFHF